MERVLITGANGFIGSNLCSYFLERSYEVFGLVRETSDLHFLEGAPVNLIRGDLAKTSRVDLPSSIDYVIHAASLVLDDVSMAKARQNILDTTVNLVQSLEDNKIPVPAVHLHFDGARPGAQVCEHFRAESRETPLWEPFLYPGEGDDGAVPPGQVHGKRAASGHPAAHRCLRPE